MSNVKDRLKRRNPVKNKSRAWEIAVNPGKYTKSERNMLIRRGLEHYVHNGELHEEKLIQELSDFISTALELRGLRDRVLKNPSAIINYPGKMALHMALGSELVKLHEEIRNDPRDGIVYKHVREYYLNLLITATKYSDNRTDVLIPMGELVYGRDQEDEYGPPVSRPVEGITQLDGTDGWYFQIPLVHANRKCEARAGNKRQGDLLSLVKGKHVYVPVQDVYPKYEEYFTGRSGVASQLEAVIRNSMGNEKLKVFQGNLKGVNKTISEWIKTGHDNRVFKERRYPAKLEVIMMAVEAADEDIAKLGEPVTAEDIYNAVRDYATRTDQDWVPKVADKMSSPSSIATTLKNYVDDDDVGGITHHRREGKADKYELEYKVGNFTQVEVTEVADLLELPCMRNLHESLMEQKPVRWELYSFVRYLFEVKNANFTVEEIKEWFSQYPWYREDVTKYQVEYEKDQRTLDGDRPLPISCNNDNRNWAEHCIGKENCDYSLYQSVQLRDDVYTRTGGN